MPERAAPADSRRVRVEHVMGTAVGVDLREPWVTGGAVEAFFAWLREVDARFSTYRAGSEISRIGAGELALADAHPDVHEVLGLCEEVGRRSGGVFAVNRPDGRLDPSALVKGWSVERGARLLEDAGARNLCVNAGGDVLARGEPEPGRAWRVGIRHPEVAGRVAAVLAVRDLAVATSGLYERGDHILDPRSGAPVRGLLSMTVAGPSLALADAYSTAAFVMGPEGVAWVAGIPGYVAYAVTAERRCLWTEGCEPLLVQDLGP
jgi:thiamine biosynthesis lipoprotein